MAAQEPVRYLVEDGIVTVTIDRPERKNALSVEAMNGLTDAWARAEADPSARVVILTSTDCGVFSAGLDLKQAAEIRARGGIDILTLMRDPMQTAMRKVSKPIIAAMTGSLMAGGMLLAIKCDLRVGLRGTRAGITEVKMGRGSPWAVPLLWMLPQPVLMELVLTGETVPIERLAQRLRQLFGGYTGRGPSAGVATGTYHRRRSAAFGKGGKGERACCHGSRLRARTGRSQPPTRGDLRQPRCHRGPESLCGKAQAEMAGQIGHAFLMPSKIRSSVRRASFRTASLLSNLNHSIVQFSAPSTKIRSGTISMSARISPARRAFRNNRSQYLA
jgi:hypothetical protein